MQGLNFTNVYPDIYAKVKGRSLKPETLLEQENLIHLHDARGVVTMNYNGGTRFTFFITFGPQPHLEEEFVVFGKVTQGMDVLNVIEKHGSRFGVTNKTIQISSCGSLNE